MIEAVIFDMDGLMFGTEQLTRELWDKLGEELGYHNISVIIPETMGVRFNESEPIFKRRFGPDFPFTVFAAEYLPRRYSALRRPAAWCLKIRRTAASPQFARA
jgi:beta-phosphoglucomutase-like phosphatase (HAD superfamily)